jgi:tellurite methyltransferase
MSTTPSVGFFDAQFERQLREGDFRLNPFELVALPYLRGRVLDYGCGLGNLSIAAAQRGCSVIALDASPTAIDHLRRVAAERSLAIEAKQADLRTHRLTEEFDAVVSIGLLMFFDCPSAFAQLEQLESHLRPGGIAAVNVLVEGTTYMDMFDPASHCLFSRDALRRRFAGWTLLHEEYQEFPAPNGQIKAFATLIARKPQSAARS